MSRRPIVLDSWALMAFFESGAAAEGVEQIILDAQRTGTALLMCVVNAGELWYSVARAYSAADADRVIRELATLGVQLVDADWPLAKQAAAYQARGRLALADCCAAALAKLRRAELVTGDPELKRLEGDVKIVWI